MPLRPFPVQHIVGPAAPPATHYDKWVIVIYDPFAKVRTLLVSMPWVGLVFDEAHYLQNHTSSRSRHAREIVSGASDAVVATHPRQARDMVTMQPAHYASLLRVDQTPLLATPPQHDPRYLVAGQVMTRDLAVYEQHALE